MATAALEALAYALPTVSYGALFASAMSTALSADSMHLSKSFISKYTADVFSTNTASVGSRADAAP